MNASAIPRLGLGDQSAAAGPAVVHGFGRQSGVGQGRVPDGVGAVLRDPDAGEHRALAPHPRRGETVGKAPRTSAWSRNTFVLTLTDLDRGH